MVRRTLLLVLGLLLGRPPSAAPAATIRVPSEHPTIQAGVLMLLRSGIRSSWLRDVLRNESLPPGGSRAREAGAE